MQKSSQFLIILAAFCWGLIGVFTRQLTAAGFSFVEIASSRSVITAVCLFSYLLLTDREKLKIKRKDSWIFLCMGGFGIVLNNVCYFNTIELITLSAASIIIYTAPYMVIVMSVLVFKEKITLQKMSALLIAFTGCIMTVGVTNSGEVSIMGITSGLGSAFGYALYSIFGRIALQKYHPFTVTAYTFAVAGIALAPASDMGNMFMLLSESAVNFSNLLVLGIFLTLVPYVCYTKGLEEIEASRASIIAFVEPLTAAAAGMVVYGEMLSLMKILGMGFIFFSLVILNVNPKKLLEASFILKILRVK
ncbi:DMT family transporter [Sinanaerobacter chloroacetimidivorans]|uniref:EamA family transporter n=1 Tax=Sinanaerobacter chloroacetimidivorans TaxID=2818044 RepID=A0A8J7W4Y7_9FIRM|nr:EamA family transporter [Sinanaerobacter chloroacetimidivorans]MBR0599443.1 EamA family transporter [Sinanaerobacter chloroacetimidivorans]